MPCHAMPSRVFWFPLSALTHWFPGVDGGEWIGCFSGGGVGENGDGRMNGG